MLPDPADCRWKPHQRWDLGAWCSPTVKAGWASGLGGGLTSTLDHTGFPALGRAIALQWRVELPQSPALSRLLDRPFSVPPRVSGLSGSPNRVVLLKSTGSSRMPGRALDWQWGGGVKVYSWAGGLCVATIISLSLCLSLSLTHNCTHGHSGWSCALEGMCGGGHG